MRWKDGYGTVWPPAIRTGCASTCGGGTLAIDDAVEILTEDAPWRREDLLAGMAADDADRIRALLAYPPYSAGRLMTEQDLRLRAWLTGEETPALLRAGQGCYCEQKERAVTGIKNPSCARGEGSGLRLTPHDSPRV